jgi:hypothetical protein
MKNVFTYGLLLLSFGISAHSAPINHAAKCALESASADAPDWKSQVFPLIATAGGYETGTSVGSGIFSLTKIDPSELDGWPTYGGTYYKGNNDLWVIITAQDAKLPDGIAYKVVKPLETDPNTNARPAVYLCPLTAFASHG